MKWRFHGIRPPVEVSGRCPKCGAWKVFETWKPYLKTGMVRMMLSCECGEWFPIETPGLPGEVPVETEEIGW